MRELKGVWQGIIGALGLLFFLFLLYTGFRIAFHPLVQGPVCVGFGLIVVFILYPARRSSSREVPSRVDIALAVLTIPPIAYLLKNWYFLAMHPMEWTTTDVAMSTLLLVLAVEASRRCVGWALTSVALVALAYAFWGHLVPGFWGHGRFNFEWVMGSLYQTTRGYWGIVTWAVSAVVPLYIIFAPVLFGIGAAPPLMALAKWVGGKVRGGGAITATIASAFFGMLSGSPIANVMTTGSFTIPAMKSSGFDNDFAGAVEAAASTGGMITPPIMAATAFILAEYLSLPYVDVMIAAIIPAGLYFFTIGMGVFFHASSKGLGRLPPHLVPELRKEIRWRNVVMIVVPVGLLLTLLAMRFIAQYCAAVALVAGILLYMLAGGGYHLRDIKQRLFTVASSITRGVRAYAWVIVVCFMAQVIVAMVCFTGIGAKFTSQVVAIGEANLLAALILSAMVVFILGMGLPAVGAYVIGIAVAGPALVKLGIMPLAAHFFVFYTSLLSNITPPVCLAVYPAAALAEGNWLRTAWHTMGLGLSKFLVPFLMVYHPALLCQGSWSTILTLVAVTGLALICFEAVWCRHYFLKHLSIAEVVMLVGAGIALILPETIFKLTGLGLMVLTLLSQRFAPPIPFIGHRFGSAKLPRDDS